MYAPTMFDWTMFIGTLGFFFALIFLFVRMLPVISIFEVRTLLPQAHVHGHQQDFDENVLEVESTYDRTEEPFAHRTEDITEARTAAPPEDAAEDRTEEE
jgi:hypothetical protein